MRFLFAASIFVALSVANAASKSTVQTSVVDNPVNCFAEKKYPCSLRSQTEGLKFERGSVVYVLGDKSSLKWISEDRIQLLQGRVWLQNAKDIAVMGHPQFEFSFSGEIFLQKQSDGNLLVRNLGANVQFHSPGVFKEESLPVGFQNWYGRLNFQKQVDRGILRAIDVTAFIKTWIPMSNLSIAEAKGRVHEWKESWNSAVEASAQFYQEIVERRLASQIELDQRRADRQKAALDERSRIRQLYRQKTGFAPDSQ